MASKKRSIDEPASSCLIDVLACICSLTLHSSQLSLPLMRIKTNDDIIDRIFDGVITKSEIESINDRNILWSCIAKVLQEDPLFIGESNIITASTYLPLYLKRLMGALICTAEVLVNQDESIIYEVGKSLYDMMMDSGSSYSQLIVLVDEYRSLFPYCYTFARKIGKTPLSLMDLWSKLLEYDKKENDTVTSNTDDIKSPTKAPSTPNLTDESDIDLVDLTNVSNNDGFDIEEDDCDLNQSLLQVSRKPKVTRMRYLTKVNSTTPKSTNNTNIKHDRIFHSAVSDDYDKSSDDDDDNDIIDFKEENEDSDENTAKINDSSPIHQYISNVLDDDDDDDHDDDHDDDDDDHYDDANEYNDSRGYRKINESIVITNMSTKPDLKSHDDDDDNDDDNGDDDDRLISNEEKRFLEMTQNKDKNKTVYTNSDSGINNDIECNNNSSCNNVDEIIEIEASTSDTTLSHLFPTLSESPLKLKTESITDESSEILSTLKDNLSESRIPAPEKDNLNESRIPAPEKVEPLKCSISQSSLSDVTENSSKQPSVDNITLDVNRQCQSLPLSAFATRAGVIYEGWLEKTSSITGLWLKRYYVLSESASEFCVLRVYGKAVKTAYGLIPINLKTIIPISCVQSVISSAAHKGKELKVTIQHEYGRSNGYCNVSDVGSINSDDVRSYSSGKIKCLTLKAPDAQSRLLWVTFINNALDALHEALNDRLEL